jgi:hypothetical protein
MKTAVLIFGMLRQFSITAKDWNFDKYLDCDYYISTWDKSLQKIDNHGAEVASNYRAFNVTEEYIKNIIPNITCSILKEKEIFPLECSTQAKMFFHWKNVFNLMLKSQKQYDLIVLIRPDISLSIRSMGASLNDPLDTPITSWEYSEDILYCDDLMKIRKTDPTKFPTEEFHYLSNDLLFCGSPTIMARFINSIPDMNKDKFKYYPWIPHVDLGRILKSSNLYPNDIHPFQTSYPIRPHPWQTNPIDLISDKSIL